ncbi:uncharacterized protein APUU_30736A [Aspergillus puulaauensis]|uniref:C2H2-type domain-containing protein n=1 Tax=Aspergillus puulaauensis TaxID=1220207 RepID=A0A7R8AKR2_9EURO|nr:uncharacterized protein APUU_30736A [Aspergillus puulaauensis]BCS22511.1 hypothetical protein APUU_30736A [Aspergillus puulaauensis]
MVAGARRDFLCLWKHCGKSFHRNSDLRRHYRIHTNERPYRCGVKGCNKGFIQRSALTVHSRTHTGEKPFMCNFEGCRSSFSDSSSLARHRGIHTNRRAYVCPEPTCKRSFRRKATLTNHQHSSHALDLAIQTLSQAYSVSESEPEYDQTIIPTTPLTPLPPQHDPYPFPQQGNWYWSYPNITSPTQDVVYSSSNNNNSSSSNNLPVTFPTAPVQEHSPIVTRNENYSRPPQAMSPELLYGQDYLQFMQQQQQYMQVSQQKPQLYSHGHGQGQSCMTPNPGWQCSNAKRLMHPGDGMGCCILY